MASHKKTIENLRRAIGDTETFGPVSEDRIRAAEKELGLSFPLSYRLYLREFGAVGEIFDQCLYGLPDTRDTDPSVTPSFLNVIDQTLSFRETDWVDPELTRLVPYAIDIGLHSGGAAWYLIDTSAMDEDGEAPVLIYGGDIPLQVFAPSFLEFLRRFSDEENPITQFVEAAPRSRPAQVATEPSEEAEPRSVTWLAADLEAANPGTPPMAGYYGVDERTRDVFVHAQSTGLDLEQQIRASEAGDLFFANPTGRGGFEEAFVATDYLAAHRPELAEAGNLAELKRSMLEAFDRHESGAGEG